MSNKQKQGNEIKGDSNKAVPFVLLTKEGVYTLDTIYMEKFFGSIYLAGHGPSVREVTVVEGDYETLYKMLEMIHTKVQECANKNKECVIDLRDLDKDEKKTSKG